MTSIWRYTCLHRGKEFTSEIKQGVINDYIFHSQDVHVSGFIDPEDVEVEEIKLDTH